MNHGSATQRQGCSWGPCRNKTQIGNDGTFRKPDWSEFPRGLRTFLQNEYLKKELAKLDDPSNVLTRCSDAC